MYMIKKSTQDRLQKTLGFLMIPVLQQITNILSAEICDNWELLHSPLTLYCKLRNLLTQLHMFSCTVHMYMYLTLLNNLVACLSYLEYLAGHLLVSYNWRYLAGHLVSYNWRYLAGHLVSYNWRYLAGHLVSYNWRYLAGHLVSYNWRYLAGHLVSYNWRYLAGHLVSYNWRYLAGHLVSYNWR